MDKTKKIQVELNNKQLLWSYWKEVEFVHIKKWIFEKWFW